MLWVKMKNLTTKGKFLTPETFYSKIYIFPNSVNKIASGGLVGKNYFSRKKYRPLQLHISTLN